MIPSYLKPCVPSYSLSKQTTKRMARESIRANTSYRSLPLTASTIRNSYNRSPLPSTYCIQSQGYIQLISMSEIGKALSIGFTARVIRQCHEFHCRQIIVIAMYPWSYKLLLLSTVKSFRPIHVWGYLDLKEATFRHSIRKLICPVMPRLVSFLVW